MSSVLTRRTRASRGGVQEPSRGPSTPQLGLRALGTPCGRTRTEGLSLCREAGRGGPPTPGPRPEAVLQYPGAWTAKRTERHPVPEMPLLGGAETS